jgi:hypothetical protein
MSCTHICSPLDPVSQSLEIRQATTKFGIDQLRAALNDEHYLMAGRPAGNTIWQGIYPTDPDDDWPVLCAVLCRSGAALRPNDRDEWISWDPLTRGRRPPLVTQLRRFLVLQSRRARERDHHVRRPAQPKKTNCLIFEIGGDNLSAIKNHQENDYQYAEHLLAGRPVDLAGELARGHGRYEVRDITLVAVDTEVSPFPHLSQIVKCTRIYRPTKEGAEPEMSVRLFGTSHEYGSKTAAQIGKLIRGHWGVENLNHWKRDAPYWREDRGPKRNPKGAKNLALLRNALLAVIPFEEFDSLNDAFDYYRDHREKSVKLIKTARPCHD